jgi:tetratricopeptide (TPR) repeat protein
MEEHLITNSSYNEAMQSNRLFASLTLRGPWNKADSIVTVILILVFVLFYGGQVSDFPALEDDGLFVLASAFLGTAHSPGYPLFVLLSQVTHLLPVESVAHRVHLFGSLTASIGLGLLYYIGRRHLGLERLACLIGVVGMAFSTLFWEQALIAEAYQLNGVLFLSLLALSARLGDTPSPGKLLVLASGFLLGLSLSNHWPLTLLMAPVFLVLAMPALTTAMKLIPLGLAGVMLGLIPYAWMFFSGSDARFSHMGEFPGIREYVYFISRDVYADVDQKQIATINDKLLFFRFYIREMADQFSLLALPFIVLGLFATARQMSLRFMLAVSYTILFPVVVIVLLDFTYTRIEAGSMRAYFLTVHLALGMMLMAGVSLVLGYSPGYSPGNAPGNGSRWPFKLPIILSPVLLLVVVFGFLKNRDIAAGGEQNVARDHGRYVLSRMPDGANLFVMDNWLMAAISYLHYVDGVRPDVHLYSQYGTFLPNRLFNYFSLGTSAKWQVVERFIQTSDQPTFMLAEPNQLSMTYTDLVYAYQVDAPGSEVEQRDLDFMESLLKRSPQDRWERLSYEENANRLSIFVILADLDEQFFSGNFLLNLLAAEQLLLSGSGEVSTDRVERFLGRAQELIDDQSEFDRVRLYILKGHLMMRLGRFDIAREFYEMALAILPVPHSSAILALGNLYSLACDQKSLALLQETYPVSDLSHYWSQMAQCN